MYRSLALNLLLIAVASSQPMYSIEDITGKIIAPTQEPTYEMPASCQATKESYCFEKGPNYPQNKIDALLEDFQKEVVISPERPFILGSRAGPEAPDCPFNTSSKPIYYIIDQKNNTRVVVQSSNFTQKYTVTWCQKEGRITENSTHFTKNAYTLEHFNVTCVNSRMDFQFIVLNENNFRDEPALEIVKTRDGIPVYCECMVQ